jgi:hypothetical protein
MAKTATDEQPAIVLAAPKQLVFTAAEAAARLGGIVSAFWLERGAAKGEIPCTYIAGHLGFTEEHMRWLIAAGERDPENYGRPKSKS